jgi:hypothetical protein
MLKIVGIERDRATPSGIDDRTTFAIGKLCLESRRRAAHTDLAIWPLSVFSFDAARSRTYAGLRELARTVEKLDRFADGVSECRRELDALTARCGREFDHHPTL